MKIYCAEIQSADRVSRQKANCDFSTRAGVHQTDSQVAFLYSCVVETQIFFINTLKIELNGVSRWISGGFA